VTKLYERNPTPSVVISAPAVSSILPLPR
jgi:hypothetical protein